MPAIVFGQKTITGTVTDADTGEPLIGVNILISGTASGTVTDFDGSYSLELTDGAKSLVFSYTGYETQEYVLDGSGVINISLTSGELLEEVVVIGYGTVKREDVTGSLQSVSAKDFNRGSITGPQELLSGKIPGVTINTDGGPGSGSRIRIRGESSLNASNNPLIIIDGVPLDDKEISGSRNVLNIINPNDIESMTVLKDASASAIYGNRASGGVILITTKKGKLGDVMRLGYNGNISFGSPVNKVDVLTASEYRAIINEQFEEGHPARGLLGEADTDWQDEVYQTAIGHDHNINVSGGVGNFPYRVSLGYSNKDGLIKTDKFKRLTAGINLTPSYLDNRLQLKFHGKMMNTKNHFADRGAIGNAASFDPTHPVRDPDSPYGGFYTWVISSNGNPNSLAPTNPIALLELKDDNSTVNRYLTNASADYRFAYIPDLRANLNLAYDYSKSEGTVVIPNFAAFDFDEINGGGTNNKYNQKKKNTLLEFYLNYKKYIGKNSFDIMGGYSWQHFKIENTFTNSDQAGTPSETTTGSDPTEHYLLSLFGRMNYSFDERYLFTFTLRRDGTSRFSPDSRWGLFPAVALAVKVVDNDKAYFNKLKLRAGWGITGQEEINDDYPYLARYQSSFSNASYQFGNEFINTIRPNGYDANIQWEETATYNIGLDFSIIKNRLSGSLDIYQKNTKDLLNEIPVPAGTNLTNFIITNVGNMENQGLEISLNTTPYLAEKNSWNFAINLAYNKSEITKLTATDDPNYQGVLTGGISGGVGSNIQIHSVGFAPSSFFVFEQKYDDNGNILEGEFVDRNGDGTVDGADKYRFEKPAPDYTLGFTSSLKISDFTLSFAGRASLGNYVYNNIQTDQGYFDRLYGTTNVLWNINRSAIDDNVQKQTNLTFSDHFVQEASFLKIDHITLGYNLDKILGYGINVYATVQNPFVITGYDGLDPEIGNGIDNNIYPRSTNYVFGLSANFTSKNKK
ncbi:MAG TPA: SusC/RagA family TonB-linked outer membrane protein [Bacteroidetes bacterium]|nr:SusC/RagA family TonB-linked outer membrane protein [Bacteroidota bacterium]